MTLYLSNRDGNGKTSEEGHYKFQTAVWAGSTLGAAALQVTENSPTGMSVLVATGQIKIDTSSDYSYTGWNTSAVVVNISTSDPANPRISTIVAYVDKGASTSPSPPNNPGIIKIISVNGTAGAIPVAPNDTAIQAAVGAGNPYVVLADVRANAAATQILNANITDRRVRVTLGSDLVSTASLLDSSVTTPKMADSSVTTVKLSDGSVTTVKVGDNQITAAKIETQQAWVTPSLSNSWAHYGSGFNDAGYMRDSLGFVHLRGMIRTGTVGSAAFTLPSGYRPINTILNSTISNNSTGRVSIYTSGQVTPQSPSSNTWVSLEGIIFKAEI